MVDAQIQGWGADWPCTKLPILVHISQAPWPPGMNQTWAGKKGRPMSWVLTEESSLLAWALPSLQDLLLREQQCPLVTNKGLFILFPQRPTPSRGTHVITWPDQKCKGVPVNFSTQAKVTDDDGEALSQPIMHFPKEPHYYKQMVSSPSS